MKKIISVLFTLALVIGIAISTAAPVGAHGGVVLKCNIGTATIDGYNPLAISSVAPVAGSTGVAVNSTIKVVFFVPMNASTLTTTTFTINRVLVAVAQYVPGTVTYDTTSLTATFTPSGALDYNQVYAATITTGALSTFGDGLATNYVWTFTTAAAPTPPPTTPPPTKGGTNWPVIIGPILAALIVVGVVTYILMKRREK